MNKNNFSYWFARLGAASIFLTFGIWEIVQPTYWTGFVPQYALTLAPVNTLVIVHGIILVPIGLAFLFLSRYIRYVAIIASLVLISIIFTLAMESGLSDILVRDVSILLFTIALIF